MEKSIIVTEPHSEMLTATDREAWQAHLEEVLAEYFECTVQVRYDSGAMRQSYRIDGFGDADDYGIDESVEESLRIVYERTWDAYVASGALTGE